MEKKLIITNDGSPSFEVGALKETYHSRHGALTESTYVYIQKGLSHWLAQNKKKECRIFELGFGTGINALLCHEFAHKNQLTIAYTTIEKYPLTNDEVVALNASIHSGNSNFSEIFKQLHSHPWDKKQQLTTAMALEKIHGDYFDYTQESKFDVLFYDAFGAHAQPELWSPKALEKAVQLMEKNAVWVSYCAKGSVRRALQDLGLLVERLPGPPGKREMLRATRSV
jgi:tRNA U34 5-methylaminomethyl-2-thiouridine-forming methyltransferase MnmC